MLTWPDARAVTSILKEGTLSLEETSPIKEALTISSLLEKADFLLNISSSFNPPREAMVFLSSLEFSLRPTANSRDSLLESSRYRGDSLFSLTMEL